MQQGTRLAHLCEKGILVVVVLVVSVILKSFVMQSALSGDISRLSVCLSVRLLRLVDH